MKEKTLPPHRNKETENKKINEPSWSPFDCVTSRVTQQQGGGEKKLHQQPQKKFFLWLLVQFFFTTPFSSTADDISNLT